MEDPNSNHAESTFRSMKDLADAIIAARTFGMRDVTVTTVHHPSSRNSRGEHIAESTDYILVAGMLSDLPAEAERHLAHIGDVRAELDRARTA